MGQGGDVIHMFSSKAPRHLHAEDDPQLRQRRLRAGMRCPHCKGMSKRRSSEEITPLYWNIYYTCLDPRCGHTWMAELSYKYGMSPSAIPDPDIDLPVRLANRDQVLRDQTGPPPGDPNQPRLFGD